MATCYFAHDQSSDSAMHNLIESHFRNALSGSETIGTAKHDAIKNSNTE